MFVNSYAKKQKRNICGQRQPDQSALMRCTHMPPLSANRIISKGGSRMISEGGGSIKSYYRSYSTYSDRQAWVNSVDPDQTPQNAASDQGLHFLPLTQQFYTHSQVVKWTCWREVKRKVSQIYQIYQKFSMEMNILVNPSLAEHDIPCLSKQCRSFRSQLIWISTVCH